MTKLIYTISTGHSGSTLLDLVLGSIPGIFATGAMNCIMWQVYRNNLSEPSVEEEDICTCLKSFTKCAVWTQAFQLLSKKAGFSVTEHPSRFRIPLMRHKFWGHKSLSRDLDYKVYKRVARVRHLDAIASLYHRKYRNTIKNNWLLIDSIGAALDVGYVSDSSKDFVRFNLLRSARPSGVVLVLLIRELYGVANSYIHGLGSMRKSAFDLGRFCASYVRFYNSMAAYCEDRGIEPLIVKYEDLSADPVHIRRGIAGKLNLPVPDVLTIDTRNNHLVAGNPMRYRGIVDIRYDDAWRRQLTDRQCAVISEKLKGLHPIYGQKDGFLMGRKSTEYG